MSPNKKNNDTFIVSLRIQVVEIAIYNNDYLGIWPPSYFLT